MFPLNFLNSSQIKTYWEHKTFFSPIQLYFMFSNQIFLTKKQIASELDISPKTLYRRLKKYEIPYDGELIPLEKAKNIADILTKSPQKDSNTNMEHRP